MAVDGLVADDQRICDLLAGLSLSDQLHDLELTRGQRILGDVLLAGGRSLEVVANQRRGCGRVDKGSPRIAARQASIRSRLASDFKT